MTVPARVRAALALAPIDGTLVYIFLLVLLSCFGSGAFGAGPVLSLCRELTDPMDAPRGAGWSKTHGTSWVCLFWRATFGRF